MSEQQIFADALRKILGEHAYLRVDSLQYSAEYKRLLTLQLASHLLLLEAGCPGFTLESGIRVLRDISSAASRLADELEQQKQK